MAEFTCPHFDALQVALLCDKPTKVNIDVTMRSTFDTHGKSSFTFHDSLSLLAKYAVVAS